MPKLYGDIINGKEFMSFEFTDKDFSKYFGKEDKFKSIIATSNIKSSLKHFFQTIFF